MTAPRPSIIERPFDPRREVADLRHFSSLQKRFQARARRRITRPSAFARLIIELRTWRAASRIFNRAHRPCRTPHSL